MPIPSASVAHVNRYKSELQPLLEEFIGKQCVPGFTIVVVEGLRVAYSYSVGVTDLENPKPVTNRSLFHMASVTKPFTGTAVLQLAQRGKIDLDAPAADSCHISRCTVEIRAS